VARGAEVTVIAANVALPDPAGAKVIRVGTALELRDAMRAAAADAQVIVANAAVADFRPKNYAASKIKKSDEHSAPVVELVQNPHVLRELGRDRLAPDQTVVGFAAETGDERDSFLDLGRRKVAAYGVDLLVVNEVGADKVFGQQVTQGVIVGADGVETEVPLGSKRALADAVWDRVARLRGSGVAEG
jgi:phosphopantothenoylcysteine decarboxylase/phosphopantothenate--cysteine ligase